MSDKSLSLKKLKFMLERLRTTLDFGHRTTIKNVKLQDVTLEGTTIGADNTMGDGFVLEDGDGTEVTITENKEIKFIEGTGIDINWTDVDPGSDGDPYDLTFTVDLEGTELKSTGEGGGSKFLREDGDGTCSWQSFDAISFDGSTANGLLTYKDSDEATVESNLTYDGTTFTINDDTMLKDDHKFYFGTNSDAYIEYDEAEDNYLVISGSANGMVLSGSTVKIDGSLQTDIGYIQGKFLHYTQHVFNKNSGTSLIYIPLNTTTDQADFQEYAVWVAPHDGRLIKVMVRPKGYSGNFGGSTVVGLHINRNATAAQTVTETLGSDATVTYTFTSSNTFSAGDLLSLSMDVSTAPGDVNIVAVWEYDSST